MHRDNLFQHGFRFTAAKEEVDEDGIWNPIPNGGPFSGGLQINVSGDKERFLKLSEYFKRLAEAGPDDHDHCEVISEDQATRLHFIFRTRLTGK